jgi:hypothetical protein
MATSSDLCPSNPEWKGAGGAGPLGPLVPVVRRYRQLAIQGIVCLRGVHR